MGRKQSPKKKDKKKIALVFGESENDTKALTLILRHIWAETGWVIEARKKPPVLIKDAKISDVPSRVSKIMGIVRAASVDAEVMAVVAHEDCDAVEPAHQSLQEKIEAAFSGEDLQVLPATPAWETETWLMLWPDAFPEVVSSWPVLEKYRNRNVGSIVDAKEELAHAVVATGSKRAYRESDAPTVFSIVINKGWLRATRAKSDSWSSFLARADALSK